MTIDTIYFENLLKTIGFKLQNGAKRIYKKEYNEGYVIKIDFNKEKIEYKTRKENCILVSHGASSNFSNHENIVVLECVDRLLCKGYKPGSIELEHSWSSGHRTSARLDIMVKKDNQPYLMIECKTYGAEFEKEKNNMLKTKKVGNEEQPKGQLFSYCFQEKTTEYMCLYTSTLSNNKVIFENAIIPVEDNWKLLSNQIELYNYWNKSFKKNGIFEEAIKPYQIECKSLYRRDLEKITNEDSSRIFNQFLEILRHNAVSDKPNAFNKILNLFICKIVDEEKADDKELQFQWKDDSTYVSLQSDLEELYKKGMDRFLDIEVTDYSDSDIERNLVLIDDNSKAIIKKMFQELRLQKNPEFAFKEVFNQKSFEENAKVLKEVVKLLQPYQFRYGHKQQFLGDFFEQLLNTSIKQESGQFFTPVPIARFMISSLPIKETLDKNIATNSKNILPIAIDYACGSGHFLTEYMDILQEIINDYDTSTLGKTLKNKIQKWKQSENENENQGEFEWAKDCVYGIEKDYRLVKTAKISTFLNGDGEANIIHADGLDKFTSLNYKGLLCSDSKINSKFDFVIANPPYSVSSFKQTLSSDNSDFVTYSFLTENSSEIECLFVERTYQLLKDGGCAAIILPSSIFSNSGALYEETRSILLKYFYIRAIAKMGKNTFMATGTNTVIVFIEKRPDTHQKQIKMLIDDFFSNYNDFSYDGSKNVVTQYINDCFDNISFDEYISFIINEPTDSFKLTTYYKDFMYSFNNSKELIHLRKLKSFNKLNQDEQKFEIEKLIQNKIVSSEKEKMFYYLLTFKTETLIVKCDNVDEEKVFLGYEFTKRRGYEGIHYFKDKNGNIVSSLYDELNLFDNHSKANFFINHMFKSMQEEIPTNMKNNLIYLHTPNLLDFNNINFNTTITLNKKERPVYTCDSLPLGVFCEIKIGGTPSRENHSYFTGKNLWVSIAEMNGQTITDTKEKITDEGITDSNVKLIKKGTTLLSFKLSIGKVALAGKDLYTNEAIAALEIKEEYKESILDEYLFYLFKSKIIDITGYTKSFGESLNSKKLEEIIIPLLNINEQKDFINKCKQYDSEIALLDGDIRTANSNKLETLSNIFSKEYNYIALGDEQYLTMKRGPFGGDLKKEIFVSSGYKVYEQKNAINNDFSLGRYYITKEKFDSMNMFEVQPNDIIMSCSGTIGKLALAPINIEPGIINQALLRFRATKKILPEYLLLCLNEITHNFKHHGLGLQNLSSVDSLKTVKIPIPYTINEQQKIIDEVNVLADNIKKLEKQKENLQQEQKDLIKKYLFI